MKKVSYKLEDMQEIAILMNEITEKGLTLRQSCLMAKIAEIIDNNNTGITNESEEELKDNTRQKEHKEERREQ